MTEPTTTKHRPGCTRPGWTVETTQTMQTVAIARCDACGATQLRTTEGNSR